MDDFKQDSFQQTSSSGEVNFLMADPQPQEDPQQKKQKKHRQKKHSSVKRMVVTACCVCVLGSGDVYKRQAACTGSRYSVPDHPPSHRR